MIFLTVGSHEPFDRLVKAVDDWCQKHPGTEVFGQVTGRGTYRPRYFQFVQNLDISAFEDTLNRAEILISHAGMGTIISALIKSKPIVVMPRQGKLHETRNDHQIATASRLAEKQGIVVAKDTQDLPASIALAQAMLNVPAIERLSQFAQPRLLAYLSGVFEGG
jgi:UDP-N-acetylglucosamine transferase subunit ALG13